MRACKLLGKIQEHSMQEVLRSLNKKLGLAAPLTNNKATTILTTVTFMIIHVATVVMAATACRSPVRGQKTGLSRTTRRQVLLTDIANHHTL